MTHNHLAYIIWDNNGYTSPFPYPHEQFGWTLQQCRSEVKAIRREMRKWPPQINTRPMCIVRLKEWKE